MKYEKLTEWEKARHPSIHYTGSVRCGQYIYNLSILIGSHL